MLVIIGSDIRSSAIVRSYCILAGNVERSRPIAQVPGWKGYRAAVQCAASGQSVLKDCGVAGQAYTRGVPPIGTRDSIYVYRPLEIFCIFTGVLYKGRRPDEPGPFSTQLRKP